MSDVLCVGSCGAGLMGVGAWVGSGVAACWQDERLLWERCAWVVAAGAPTRALGVAVWLSWGERWKTAGTGLSGVLARRGSGVEATQRFA
ncbi:hypothetical protein CF642_39460 [Burkholderia pseudomallei]|nr:hypothetical protein CF642_39460 [Burkholderia pseudomallei]